MQYRIEHDSMGEVKVPAHRYWGAQTQRSVEKSGCPGKSQPETGKNDDAEAAGHLRGLR